NADISMNGGQHSLTLAVDPNDPNIVYFGSDRLMKIDATFVNDPFNFSLYQHSNADGGLIRRETTSAAVILDRGRAGPPDPPAAATSGLFDDDPNVLTSLFAFESHTPLTGTFDSRLRGDPRLKWNFLNLARDAYNPFRVDTSLITRNVNNFTNTGA